MHIGCGWGRVMTKFGYGNPESNYDIDKLSKLSRGN